MIINTNKLFDAYETFHEKLRQKNRCKKKRTQRNDVKYFIY